MGANDKTEATFHGQLPGVRYGLSSEEIQEARLAELQTVTEAEADKNARESREPAEVPLTDGMLIGLGLQALIKQSGENSRDHGFHEDFPDLNKTPVSELRLAVTQKLTLTIEEIIEAFGEIRSGRGTKEMYFVDKKALIGPKDEEYTDQAYGAFVDGQLTAYVFEDIRGDRTQPLLKPEGFMVELADAVIRIADLVYLLDGEEEFIEALHAKHEYNKTRPFKHGRQF